MRQEMRRNCTDRPVQTAEPAYGSRTFSQVRAYSGRSRHKADMAQTAYGSEGWGFESLRARSVLRQTTRPLTSGNASSGAFVVSKGKTIGRDRLDVLRRVGGGRGIRWRPPTGELADSDSGTPSMPLPGSGARCATASSALPLPVRWPSSSLSA
jgi:hypothetical protein